MFLCELAGVAVLVRTKHRKDFSIQDELNLRHWVEPQDLEGGTGARNAHQMARWMEEKGFVRNRCQPPSPPRQVPCSIQILLQTWLAWCKIFGTIWWPSKGVCIIHAVYPPGPTSPPILDILTESRRFFIGHS